MAEHYTCGGVLWRLAKKAGYFVLSRFLPSPNWFQVLMLYRRVIVKTYTALLVWNLQSDTECILFLFKVDEKLPFT